MSIASLAQGARQSLARGLEALQARDAPPALLDVAQPVARAIGALVDLELSPASAKPDSAEPVLDALRDALRLLQVPQYVDHPAAARGMKAVAEALCAVVTLARTLQESAPSPPAPAVVSMRPGLRALASAPQSAATVVMTRAVNAVMGPAPASMRLEALSARAEPSPDRTEPPPESAEPLPARIEPLPAYAESPPARIEPLPPRIEPPPARIEPSPARVEPLPAPQELPPALYEPPHASVEPLHDSGAAPQIPIAPPSTPEPEPRTLASARPPVVVRRDVVVERDLRAVDAPLGAHSSSNFYTGLAGGDVVVSGGLFVATYQVPKVGEKLLLKISMPGGYEFVAKAKVAWTRSGSTTQSPGSMRVGTPGFGAEFCEITDEGRRLIQRYVRNREPLVHEDAL